MDKQFAFAVIMMILGFGLTQLKGDDSFLTGLGVGTIVIAAVWILFRIIKDLKRQA